MRRQLIIFTCALAVLCASAFAFVSRHPATTNSAVASVDLKGISVRITVASTEAARERGLSGVMHLADDEGMLFVFDHDDRWGFWMKDMRIPIDIVWLSADKRVVHIAQNVSPASYPSVFVPAAPARYVLELPADWSERHGLSVGDTAGF